jgi:beta-lactamase superfamily II metal-dependent hydrolase
MSPDFSAQPDAVNIFRLHVVQADYGDCLLLQYGVEGSAKYILIDGGPDGVFAGHLRYKLQEISAQHGRLDLVVLTHVDEDHVVGLVDMLSAIAQARNRGEPLLIEVSELWYNTFRPIESGANGTNDLVAAFSTYLNSAFAGGEMQSAAYSITQGEDLWKAAHILNLPLNTDFANRVVAPENAQQPVDFDGLKLWVIAPPQANLKRYKRDWDKWYNKHKNDPFSPAAASEADEIDDSVSNLSSIMFLAEVPGRRILFTGDGRCGDVMDGLKQVGLSDAHGRLHVDVLKVPHHGSLRNNSRKFFEKITARHYVIPAGEHGKDGNPDLKTLVWIVESAKKRGEQIDILVANPNDSTTELQTQYPAEEYDYTLTFLAPDQHYVVI